MPKLVADFTKISSSFENWPEGDYRVRVKDVEEGKTKTNKPQITVILECTEGDKAGQEIRDFLTMTKDDGKPNNVSLGRIKAYAEAILGDEAANNPEGIDTDDFKGGDCIILVKHKKDTRPGAGENDMQMKIDKVLAA